jgi:Leucine-rich repeat (LRR) protein
MSISSIVLSASFLVSSYYLRGYLSSLSSQSHDPGGSPSGQDTVPASSTISRIATEAMPGSFSGIENTRKRRSDNPVEQVAKKQEIDIPRLTLHAHSTRSEVEQYLTHWINEKPQETERKTAAERVLRCFDDITENRYRVQLHFNSLYLTNLPDDIFQLQPFINGLQGLILDRNQLTSIPESIGNLTALKILWLRNNQLTSIPESIGNLIALEHLDLIDNQLTSIPTSIGKLVALQILWLDKNQLTSIPTSIGNLVVLRSLCLRNNQLTSIPTSIGNLVALRGLHLYNNPQLRDLPITLGSCLNITALDTSGTAIAEETRVRILVAIRALRRTSALVDLPQKLVLWHAFAGATPVVNLESLTDEERGQVQEWLVKLEDSSDFNRYQSVLAQHVCGMLKSVTTTPSFKELFFNELAMNLVECGDRAAMLFNILYTGWKLETMDSTEPLAIKLSMLASGAKTLTLRNAIAELIQAEEKRQNKTIEESVEIFLYYETHLKERLNLLSAIQSSKHADSIGPRSYIESADLVGIVETSYFTHLYKMSAFQALFKTSADYKRIEGLTERAHDELENLEAAGNSATNEGEYLVRVKAIQEQLEIDIKVIAHAWYQRQCV